MAVESTGACGPVVSLLGPVDIFVAGRPASLSQPGLRILLAMLALSANQVVPVSALIDALWQEDASRQRGENLHVQVHLLRRRLAELAPGPAASPPVTAPPGRLLSLAHRGREPQAFASPAH